IKDTNKVWEVRKRRVKYVPLKNKIKIGIGMILLLLFFIIPFSSGMKQFIAIPNELITFQSNNALSILPTDHQMGLSTSNTNVIAQNNMLYPKSTGDSEVVFEKSNIPVKKMDVSVLADKKVVPGGESIGVQLHTMGVLVVGHHLVSKGDDDASPAESANIHVGDVILEMNGNKISKLEDVKPIVKKAGTNHEKITIKLKRGKEVMETSLKPVLNKRDNSYQI